MREGANRSRPARFVRVGLLGHVGAGSGRLGRRNHELVRVDRRALVTVEGADGVLAAAEYLVVGLGSLVFEIFVKRSARLPSALRRLVRLRRLALTAALDRRATLEAGGRNLASGL